MKKIKLLAIPALAALLITGAGCAKSNSSETNKAPSVTGVKDIQCIVNSTVDFLDGVAALDKEDGDITPDLKITVTPNVEVSDDGYAYFSEVGEYTVIYSIADSEGRTAQKRAYVDVVDREVYKTFAMPEGFTAEADGSAKIEKCGMINTEFVLKATGGEIAEDVKLSRTYTMTTNIQYTFRYTVNSTSAGKIKVLADGYDCAEIAVHEGENVITFNHTARKVGDEDTKDVKIDVCLGNLDSVDWTVNGVEYEYPQEEGKEVERVTEFDFTDTVKARIESTARGNAYVDTEKNAACLEITETCPEIWLGGMFIDTGIPMKSGVTYNVSLKVESEQSEGYEVLFQNKQWDEKKIGDTLYNPSGEISCNLPVTKENAGTLWIYVQTGTVVNKVTISDLKVVGYLNATCTEEVVIEDFTEFHADGCDSALTSYSGSFTYTVQNFSATDGDNKVTSPSFYIEGSEINYVLTFRAKASAPIEMIIVAPVYGGWDPNALWQRVNLSEEETIYTFFFYCDGNAADTMHNIIWQFGSASNQKYHDVKIEISDIKVSLKNGELDN